MKKNEETYKTNVTNPRTKDEQNALMWKETAISTNPNKLCAYKIKNKQINKRKLKF